MFLHFDGGGGLLLLNLEKLDGELIERKMMEVDCIEGGEVMLFFKPFCVSVLFP